MHQQIGQVTDLRYMTAAPLYGELMLSPSHRGGALVATSGNGVTHRSHVKRSQSRAAAATGVAGRG